MNKQSTKTYEIQSQQETFKTIKQINNGNIGDDYDDDKKEKVS